jgi:hypothetical protein
VPSKLIVERGDQRSYSDWNGLLGSPRLDRSVGELICAVLAMANKPRGAPGSRRAGGSPQTPAPAPRDCHGGLGTSMTFLEERPEAGIEHARTSPT